MTAFTERRFTGTSEERHAQWLQARKEGIGGSDAAAILGMSKYATPLTVWLEKTGRSEPDDLSENESVYWGSTLEEVVGREFKKRHPDFKVRRRNSLLRSKEHPWMLASLDFEFTTQEGKKGVLEVKTCDKMLAKDWEDGVPDYYVPQPTHYLAVTDYDLYAVAVLIGGNRYKDIILERDEDDIQALIERERVFWFDFVASDVMPEVTSTKADSEALNELYNPPNDEYISALSSDMPILDRLKKAKERQKETKDEIDLLTNELKSIIGESRGIITEREKVTWSRSEATTFEKSKFAADHPEMYEEYTVTKPKDNGLRITEVK